MIFTPFFTAKPHVFVSAASPLAQKKALTLDDLKLYPRLSYEQGEHNAFYFSEEILSTLDSKKDILVRDRATLFNLLIGLDGYTILQRRHQRGTQRSEHPCRAAFGG